MNGLAISDVIRQDAEIEWPEWENDYVPQGGLHGKTVLDVGAGEGETAAFFFSHGAAKVIAIEADGTKLWKLRMNALRFHWNVEVFCHRFRLEDMTEFDYDFAKIDCEGGEIELLRDWKNAKPFTVEIHNEELLRGFIKRFPEMKIRRRNWWRELWIGRNNKR